MKRIPIGEQTFSELIKSETLYVDKKQHIYNLIKHRGHYFLARLVANFWEFKIFVLNVAQKSDLYLLSLVNISFFNPSALAYGS